MSAGPLPGGAPVTAPLWLDINRALIAKTIGELAFEEAFVPEPINREGTQWLLRLDDGIAYRFAAERRIWGNLAIDPPSLFRVAGSLVTPAGDAAGFLVDASRTLAIEPATLCTYVREVMSTLAADVRIAAIGRSMTGPDLLRLSDRILQHYLDGHPKASASKGRIGWGLADFEAYAPEFEPEIRLFWVAADRAACRISLEPGLDEADLVADALDSSERARLAEACRAHGIEPVRYLLLPVHPWQWDHMIALQFAGEIAARRLVPLGSFGRVYLPQQSLRTLAGAHAAVRLDVKLALTILNTSAWRGVPGKYMVTGPAFSAWLAEKAAQDPELAGVVILQERAGAFYPHPVYERIADAPYQFREMLGVIWRDGIAARLEPGRSALMMGALLKTDASGRPLVSSLVARSGLDPETWLERLFDHVGVPLYHFLCRYGVGFIAHGQNVTLILENGVPCGVALKDFQGDVDLVDQDFAEAGDLPPGVRETLLRRPAAHLLQHLQTGHFASLLRFVSDALLRQDGVPEIAFYAALARALRRYQARHPDLAERFRLFDLFAPQVPRICINRVRLALGYGDSSLRPVPRLGTDLINPLHRAERSALGNAGMRAS
ncbi:IucA/IucC family siderophore biosynthesis protein [Methylobacterium durans]|uniref:IucA/IucC family protein n=1 Tax=Methylobacterium durans TaxID=2202825 RepID=UPI002B000935|nr:IucA/IucC family siderophore biosynthesis protein [Methylobacterium durans]MEA1831551.1 IucA/IucC family siderophore biosynthesis protein [Methylobacterium durans]